jgi:hypothetical protein
MLWFDDLLKMRNYKNKTERRAQDLREQSDARKQIDPAYAAFCEEPLNILAPLLYDLIKRVEKLEKDNENTN